MNRLIIFLALLMVVLTSCKKPEEAPEFRGFDKFKVKSFVEGKAVVSADATFFNPNQVKMKLKSIDVAVWVNEKEAGMIDQSMQLKIPAESNFTVPLEMTIDIRKIGALNSLLFALSDSKLPVRLKGNVRAKVHGLGFTVPIDYKDEVKIDLSQFRF